MRYSKFIIALFCVLSFPTILAIETNKYELNAYTNEYKIIKTIYVDTTGDSVKEKVKILADEESKGYMVKIIHDKKKVYMLEPDERFDYLAPYTPFWDLNMIIADINDDSIPEIVTWGDATHENEIHIFRWNGTNYDIIYSGYYQGLEFKDINSDNVPELVIWNRIYGVGYEYIYYQWQNNEYKQVFYEFDSGRGYDKIVKLLDSINKLPPNKPIFYNTDVLNYYFTEEWLSNEDNLQKLEGFNKNLLSIQIIDYIENWEPVDRDKTTQGEVWPLKVKVIRLKNTNVESKELIMEVIMKYVDYPVKDKWKINNIKFIE